MKKLRFFDLIIIVFLSLPFSYLGCGGGGGGGGGGENNPAPRTFHLYDDGEFIPGYSISFSLNGSSSAGDNFTCFLAIETRDITTIDHTSVIPQEVYMEMTNTNIGATITDISIGYCDPSSHDPVKFIIQLSGVEYTPIEISKPPDLAEVGDFGTLTSYLGSDGTTKTGTWRLENAGGGLANLIRSGITKDQNGDISSTSKATITIDESGDPLNYRVEYYYPDTNMTLNLSGGRVN
jgi:hypothetical protein